MNVLYFLISFLIGVVIGSISAQVLIGKSLRKADAQTLWLQEKFLETMQKFGFCEQMLQSQQGQLNFLKNKM